jgi:hypothetical protein
VCGDRYMKENAALIMATFMYSLKYRGVRAKIRLYEALSLITMPSKPMKFDLGHEKQGVYLKILRAVCSVLTCLAHTCVSQFVHSRLTMARPCTSYNFLLRLPISQRKKV